MNRGWGRSVLWGHTLLTPSSQAAPPAAAGGAAHLFAGQLKLERAADAVSEACAGRQALDKRARLGLLARRHCQRHHQVAAIPAGSNHSRVGTCMRQPVQSRRLSHACRGAAGRPRGVRRRLRRLPPAAAAVGVLFLACRWWAFRCLVPAPWRLHGPLTRSPLRASVVNDPARATVTPAA